MKGRPLAVVVVAAIAGLLAWLIFVNLPRRYDDRGKTPGGLASFFGPTATTSAA